MKTSSIVVFIIMSLTLSCNQKKMTKESIPHITSSFTEENMTIDGYLNETIWHSTQSVVLCENKSGSEVINPDFRTEVKTAYDSLYLYISFLCQDPDIWGKFNDRDEHLWTEEVVEVFIDTDQEANTYVEIEVSPKNVLFDSFIVDPVDIDIQATKEFDLNGIKTAVSVNGSLNDESDVDRYWTVEIAIAIEDLITKKVTIIPSKTEWRINFYRIERTRSGESTGYAWSPTGARFHRPEAFGVLRFGER